MVLVLSADPSGLKSSHPAANHVALEWQVPDARLKAAQPGDRGALFRHPALLSNGEASTGAQEVDRLRPPRDSDRVQHHTPLLTVKVAQGGPVRLSSRQPLWRAAVRGLSTGQTSTEYDGCGPTLESGRLKGDRLP